MNIALLFEQSGHFKKVLQSHGHNAKDFDIENQFNETDYIIDLFDYINKTDMNRINESDLVIAFFPCTYFSRFNNLYFNRKCINFRNMTENEIDEYIAERKQKRKYYSDTLITMVNKIKVPLIIENPASKYIKDILTENHVSMCRNKYGDYFAKPTYFFTYNGVEIRKKDMQILANDKHYVVCKSNSCKNGDGIEQTGINRSLIAPEFIENLLSNTYVNGIKLI